MRAGRPLEAKASQQAVDGAAGEVFLAFLKLGVSSFGGPVAHLGYFRDELVLRRAWIDEAGYADLVALCQFLPGPASVGYCLGLMRGGPLGGLAAWCAFTLPSAFLMIAAALGGSYLQGPVGAGLVHGLKLVAVAIVAQAVWGMARSLTPDRERAGIALVAVIMVTAFGGSVGQVAAIVFGGIAGLWLCRSSSAAVDIPHMPVPVSRGMGVVSLALFFLLLAALPLVAEASGGQALALFDAFYRSGALVQTGL